LVLDGRGSALEVLVVALRLGLTSFGGPIAHIGYFRREYVERRRWLDDAEFADLVALCQSLPGPASSQLGIAIGTGRAGYAGGLAAWLGFTLPSAALLIAFGLLANTTDLTEAPWVHGLKLAAVSVVALAVLTMARTLTPDWPRRTIAAAALAAFLLVPTPLIQLVVICGGALLGYLFVRAAAPAAIGTTDAAISRRAGVAFIGAFLLLVLGLPLVSAVAASPTLALVQGILDSGALVFGGGHVVLPLLHATTVDPGFVSGNAFLAGYGAAQAVPGPLFTFAAFLGTVADVPLNGVAGGLVCLVAIFLPSFLLIWGALPFWDRLRRSEPTRRALLGTNAAVVGLLAAALYNPVWVSSVAVWSDVAIAAIAFGALATRRVAPIVVVVGCAIAAQLVVALIGTAPV
jgi:chromate transporter